MAHLVREAEDTTSDVSTRLWDISTSFTLFSCSQNVFPVVTLSFPRFTNITCSCPPNRGSIRHCTCPPHVCRSKSPCGNLRCSRLLYRGLINGKFFMHFTLVSIDYGLRGGVVYMYHILYADLSRYWHLFLLLLFVSSVKPTCVLSLPAV